jgi:hypothetical protein
LGGCGWYPPATGRISDFVNCHKVFFPMPSRLFNLCAVFERVFGFKDAASSHFAIDHPPDRKDLQAAGDLAAWQSDFKGDMAKGQRKCHPSISGPSNGQRWQV